MKQIRAVVHGVVQGVGFRYYTRQVARALGVTGFVRNQPDGTVEIVAMGPEAQVQELLDWAHQGPASAQVTQVDVEPMATEGAFEGFTIKH